MADKEMVLDSSNKKRSIKSNQDETILVLGAHSDDFVIGAGGTISKYVSEGKKVISVVFSYGVKSHPWLKPEVVKKMRVKETFKAGEIMDTKVTFLDLEEGKFYEDYQAKEIEPQLLRILEKYKPTKVFTHSAEDPHPDHKDVNKITFEILDKIKDELAPEVYIYSVWNPVSFNTKYPSMYVDITKHLAKKIQALKAFRSQRLQVAYPFVLLLFRAIKDGFKIKKIFGESFFRVR
jgi:LmbE family N-acetylglucosaminyl deacetylase